MKKEVYIKSNDVKIPVNIDNRTDESYIYFDDSDISKLRETIHGFELIVKDNGSKDINAIKDIKSYDDFVNFFDNGKEFLNKLWKNNDAFLIYGIREVFNYSDGVLYFGYHFYPSTSNYHEKWHDDEEGDGEDIYLNFYDLNINVFFDYTKDISEGTEIEIYTSGE